MHDYRATHKQLQPRRGAKFAGLYASLILIGHGLMLLLAVISVVGMGWMAYNGFHFFKSGGDMSYVKQTFWGFLVTACGITLAIPTMVIADIVEPTTKAKMDGVVLYNHWMRRKTGVIKENLLAEVLKVGRIDKKEDTRMVRLKPMHLGEYTDWEIQLPSHIADKIKPGWFIRQRVIYYRFHIFSGDFKYAHKVIIHDENEVVRGVIELSKKGYTVTKEVS